MEALRSHHSIDQCTGSAEAGSGARNDQSFSSNSFKLIKTLYVYHIRKDCGILQNYMIKQDCVVGSRLQINKRVTFIIEKKASLKLNKN